MPKAMVLIVEDNEPLRIIYRNQLQHDDFTVLEADTVQKAYDLLIHNPIDVLLLDIMLPDKSGLDFLKTLRQESRFLKLPVLMLTSLPDEVAFEESQALNIHGYLIKNQVSPEQVSQRVKLAFEEASSSQSKIDLSKS